MSHTTQSSSIMGGHPFPLGTQTLVSRELLCSPLSLLGEENRARFRELFVDFRQDYVVHFFAPLQLTHSDQGSDVVHRNKGGQRFRQLAFAAFGEALDLHPEIDSFNQIHDQLERHYQVVTFSTKAFRKHHTTTHSCCSSFSFSFHHLWHLPTTENLLLETTCLLTHHVSKNLCFTT